MKKALRIAIAFIFWFGGVATGFALMALGRWAVTLNLPGFFASSDEGMIIRGFGLALGLCLGSLFAGGWLDVTRRPE